jgi:hypothetical protein
VKEVSQFSDRVLVEDEIRRDPVAARDLPDRGDGWAGPVATLRKSLLRVNGHLRVGLQVVSPYSPKDLLTGGVAPGPRR